MNSIGIGLAAMRSAARFRPRAIGSTANNRVTVGGRCGTFSPVPNPISNTFPDNVEHTSERIRRDCLVFITTLMNRGNTRSP